jgi:hypothetical protein
MSSLVTATLLAALSEVPAGGCIHTANVVIYGRAEHLISITLLIKGDIARYPSKTHSSSRHHPDSTAPVSTKRPDQDQDQTSTTHRVAKPTPHPPLQFTQTAIQHLDLNQKLEVETWKVEKE